MTSPGLFGLERRRVVGAMATGIACWIATGNAMGAAGVSLLALTALWGWQLSRLHRWFANPDELPPLGDAAIRGVLRDVYVLRSRGLQRDDSASSSRSYRNESLESMREAVKLVDGRAIVEASGGVRLSTIKDIAKTGVDIISIGRLTHSAEACDISMRLTGGVL